MGTLSTMRSLLTSLKYHNIYLKKYEGMALFLMFHLHIFSIYIALRCLERNIILVVVMLIIVQSVQHYMTGKKYL